MPSIDARQIDAFIAEKIFSGLVVDRNNWWSTPPGSDYGALEPIPHYTFFEAPHFQLREEMQRRGCELIVTRHPAETGKIAGQSFTARWQSLGQSFEATATAEKLAVCIAALRVVGVEIPSNAS